MWMEVWYWLIQNSQLNEFKEKYLALKKKGLKDKEIAKELFLTKSSLYARKKKAGFSMKHYSQQLKGKYQYGITAEEMEEARKIGLHRQTIYTRIKRLGWSKKDALTIRAKKCKSRESKSKIKEVNQKEDNWKKMRLEYLAKENTWK
jgi:hypothetical protein